MVTSVNGFEAWLQTKASKVKGCLVWQGSRRTFRKRWIRPTGNWRPALNERDTGFFLSPCAPLCASVIRPREVRREAFEGMKAPRPGGRAGRAGGARGGARGGRGGGGGVAPSCPWFPWLPCPTGLGGAHRREAGVVVS